MTNYLLRNYIVTTFDTSNNNVWYFAGPGNATLPMFISSSSFASASVSSQKVFKAIERLLSDPHHSQFGALVSVADEAKFYTYKQAGRDKVCVVNKQFVDERVAIGLYEGASAQVYTR